MLDALDASYAAFVAGAREVPPQHRTVRPAPDEWSVAEVVQHVANVERVLTELLSARLAAARPEGLGPEADPAASSPSFPTSLIRDRSRKIKAREALHPTPGVDFESAMTQFDATHAALRAMVVGADGLALSRVTQQHPFLGPLDFYGWMLFLAAHEDRHLGQIREAAASRAAQGAGV